jgi:hypothetical protein
MLRSMPESMRFYGIVRALPYTFGGERALTRQAILSNSGLPDEEDSVRTGQVTGTTRCLRA